jgi:hypothetical protein
MILVDAHVHIYDCFDLEVFFDSAYSNFQSSAAQIDSESEFTSVLLLTETSEDHWFRRLSEYTNTGLGNCKKDLGHWGLYPTAEKISLRARNGAGQTLLLIAGRQIVTAEHLEVLALFTEKTFTDGKPLEELIQRALHDGAIPVIPWGFGKWTGKRGRILDNILERTESSTVFLGDNGGRPAFIPSPRHLTQGTKRAARVLAGSDPMPMASEVNRVGSFGLYLQDSIDLNYPARDLRQILQKSDSFLDTYGHFENFLAFFRKQIFMQMRKWLIKSSLRQGRI